MLEFPLLGLLEFELFMLIFESNFVELMVLLEVLEKLISGTETLSIIGVKSSKDNKLVFYTKVVPLMQN
jgi:hypothetical protein